MTWLFIGPSMLSGIGQVTKTYCDLVGGEYVCYGTDVPSQASYDHGFAFVLPIPQQLEIIDKFMINCKKKYYMTVCETETVQNTYGILSKYNPVFVPSLFAKNILERQFPQMECKLLRHWAPTGGPSKELTPEAPYVFYTIGNIVDPRKNINMLVKAFNVCQFPNAKLVMKAACNRTVPQIGKNITIINGVLSNDHMDKIHAGCHCYINCSHSEGVGMGAVEAAMRNKPVIIADYGGLHEYVKTPWVISCKLGKIGFDDFMFEKDMEWGHPSFDDLVRHMKDCYEKRITSWDHAHTHAIMGEVSTQLQAVP